MPLTPLVTRIKDYASRVFAKSQTPLGRDALMFLLCLIISAILWVVMSFGNEEQFDLRLPVRITHVPDSVTLISTGPEALSVSLTAHGTEMLKLQLGRAPFVDIDFRVYRNRGHLLVSATELKALVRSATGGTSVGVVYPDSINITYTTHKGYKVPVYLDSKVSTGPNASVAGKPHLSVDSVRVFFSPGKNNDGIRRVSTEPLRLTDVGNSFTQRLRLIAPPGARVIPDSVDVTYDIEPLIVKQRRVVIEPVNVPSNVKLITFPAQIDVYYMVPMSLYATTNPHFSVLADYRKIDRGSTKMKLRLTDVPSELTNVHLSTDSVEYIIEQL